uniref:Uncharacterized protein n=1 Tax=Trichuris muris TaxID=70415 RepID=A0A5S6QRH5_TRIMR
MCFIASMAANDWVEQFSQLSDDRISFYAQLASIGSHGNVAMTDEYPRPTLPAIGVEKRSKSTRRHPERSFGAKDSSQKAAGRRSSLAKEPSRLHKLSR